MNNLSYEIALKNPPSIPMVDTHYYHWLTAQALTDIHLIHTKQSYLASEYGFVTGKSIIDITQQQTLKYIENHYFDVVIKPTIPPLVYQQF